MALALHNRQTEEITAQATLEHRIAVDVKVMRRDRGGEIRVRTANEIDRLLCGDVFKNDPNPDDGPGVGSDDAR